MSEWFWRLIERKLPEKTMEQEKAISEQVREINRIVSELREKAGDSNASNRHKR